MKMSSGLQGSWVKSLEEDSQQAVLVLLRDSKTLVGILKTFDHFGNILLDRCCERIFNPTAPNEFAEIYLGCVLVRGENIVLFGALEDLQPSQHMARLISFDPRGLIGDTPSGTYQRGVHVFEVPLSKILHEQESYRERERHAEQVWENYKLYLKAAQNDMDERSLERYFIEGLLAKSSSNQTEGEIEIARSLFHRYVQAAADALSVVENKKANSIDTE